MQKKKEKSCGKKKLFCYREKILVSENPFVGDQIDKQDLGLLTQPVLPNPRIHSKPMHGFPKIHGYQHGYP